MKQRARTALAAQLSCLLAGCAVSGPARLAARLAPHDHHPVQVAMLVVDLDSGETVFARDPQRLCRPASTMKLLTTAAVCRRAADREMPAFVTRLRADSLSDGTVTLVGDGDPLLSSDDLRELVARLRQQGLITPSVEVRVVDPLGDAPRFGEGWMWDDEPSEFLPPLRAVTVDGACATVEAVSLDESPGDVPPGTMVSLLPVPGELELVVTRAEPSGDAEADAAARMQVGRGRYRGRDVVAVRLPAGSREPESCRITVPDPPRYAGYVLADALEIARGDASVAVTRHAPARAAAVEVALRRPLADVVVHTNKVSDNLGAEMLLRLCGRLGEGGRAPLDAGSFAAGRRAVAADLAALRVAEDGYRIADGSGVSHYNLVSADLLVRLLVDIHARGGDGAALFRRSLPIAGVDGTLAERMKGSAAEGRVFAKTGTISAVSNLAGYVDAQSGRRFAFAILCQNFVGSAKPWRELQDELCCVLATM